MEMPQRVLMGANTPDTCDKDRVFDDNDSLFRPNNIGTLNVNPLKRVTSSIEIIL